jgi:AsmA protein
MPKFFKYLLIALTAIIVLVVAAAFIFAATFNPNDYKPTLIKLMQDKTQRTLAIPGDIRLTFFPRIGAELGRISLSERRSAQSFASAEQVRVSVALMPLFSRQVMIDRVLVDGLKVSLQHHKDGSSNYGDLIPRTEGGSTPEKPLPADQAEVKALLLDVGGITLSNASLKFSDEASQRQLAVSGLRLSTGPIAQGKASHLEFAATVQGNQPALALQLGMKSGFTPDLSRRRLVFDGMKASVRGRAATLSDLDITLSAPSLELSPVIIRTPEMTLESAFTQGGHKFVARFGVALQGDLNTNRFELDKLSVYGNLPNPAGDTVTLKAQGKLSADLPHETLQAALTGQLDSTNFDIKAGVKKFARPVINFDVVLGELDADRYLPKSEKPVGSAPAKAQATAGDQAIDLSALQLLDAHGSVKIASLQITNLKAKDIRLQLKLTAGKAELKPLSATLYGGSVNGELSADAGKPQGVTARLKLSGVQVGALLQDVIDKRPIDGSGNVSLDISTSGASVTQFKKGLNGTASLALKDGAINGINIAAALRDAKARLGGGSQEGQVQAKAKTDFSELGASFRIRNGVAHNDDLSAKTPLLRLGGSGDIFIAEDRLDYTLKATVVSSLEGQGGPELQQLKGLTLPVRLTGPYTAIGWKIDLGSMAGNRANELVDERKKQLQQETQKKLDDEKAKLQERLKSQVQDKLKSLLGR